MASGGLVLSTILPFHKLMAEPAEGPWEPNFYIRITPDNVVTLISSQLEIGQGTTVGLSQILADELGANWGDMKIELADGDQEKFGDFQDTGGSNGLALLWMPLRKAAAATRTVLIQATANRWNIDTSSCEAKDGFVVNPSDKQILSFGELATEASKLTLPDEPKLLDEDKFNMIGKPVAGHKQKEIVTGKYRYSLDIAMPGMVYAVIERAPLVSATVLSFDETKAREENGGTGHL